MPDAAPSAPHLRGLSLSSLAARLEALEGEAMALGHPLTAHLIAAAAASLQEEPQAPGG